MNEQTTEALIRATHYPRMALSGAFLALMLFLLAATASSLRSMHYIGAGIEPTNTISVSGEGEVFAIPDIAEFTFSVSETAKDVQTAQTNATKKTNASIAYIKEQGIEEKDIKTIDYSVNPHYEWQQGACPVSSGGQYIPCPPGKQILTGYDVSQTIQVKVRDTKKAGDVLAGVGSRGATNVSGLNFTVEDQKKLEEEARGKAIAEARDRAEALAKDLHVDLVRVVSFNEGGGGLYYAKAMMSAEMARDTVAAPAPEIPVGQNKITSNVTVVYEIR